MNIGFLRRGFWTVTSWQLQKILKVSPLSFNTGWCMSVERLPNILENSTCWTNHLKSILYSLIEVVDITDYCSINSRFWTSPVIINDSSSSRSVLCESQGIRDQFSWYPWIHFCNGYFDVYLVFNWANNVLLKNNHGTSSTGNIFISYDR